MSNYLFYDQLRKKLGDQVIEEGDQLARGLASDYPIYRERCGRIAGMQLALDYAQEIHDSLTRG